MCVEEEPAWGRKRLIFWWGCWKGTRIERVKRIGADFFCV